MYCVASTLPIHFGSSSNSNFASAMKRAFPERVGGCRQNKQKVEAKAEAEQPDSELTAYLVVMWLLLIESI